MGLLSLVGVSCSQTSDQCLPELRLLSRVEGHDYGRGYSAYLESYENSPDHWEAVSRYKCLHRGGAAVAIVGDVYTSPSGEFILFHDLVAGEWVLSDATGRRLAEEPVGEELVSLRRVEWEEPDGLIHFYSGAPRIRRTLKFYRLSNHRVHTDRAGPDR